jgi:hypothetical protein
MSDDRPVVSEGRDDAGGDVDGVEAVVDEPPGSNWLLVVAADPDGGSVFVARFTDGCGVLASDVGFEVSVSPDPSCESHEASVTTRAVATQIAGRHLSFRMSSDWRDGGCDARAMADGGRGSLQFGAHG